MSENCLDCFAGICGIPDRVGDQGEGR